MNKTQLIDAVASRTQHSKAQTAVLVDALLGILQDTLANSESVQLVGFGSFSVTDRPARAGRNPGTGEMLNIPAKKVVKFKPGKALSDSVSKDKTQ